LLFSHVALLYIESGSCVASKCEFLSCVLTAKFEECEQNIPKLAELNRLGSPNCPHTAQQYLSMELRILQFFNWNISLPTAAHFYEYFLVISVTASDCFEGRSLGDQATAAVSTVSKYVVYFLEISLQGCQFRTCHFLCLFFMFLYL